MAFLPPIGISDFRRIRQERLTYVDKTALVQRILATPSAAFLLPRPRRFGKTLNLSTLRTFLEKSPDNHTPLFEGLKVWGDPAARAHFQRYPVIFLSFKDVKHATWSECQESLASVIADALRHLTFGAVPPADQADLDALTRRTADEGLLSRVLLLLSRLLHTHHGQPVVLLIDEYDTPIHAGYVHGYYTEVVAFFRNFLSGGLKDNPYLFKGVITGILRVAKENLFSGLNNIHVFGLMDAPFAPDFGFTEDEVTALAREADCEAHLDTMRRWYNGYRFGETTLYNPWSILQFLADPLHRPQAHWVFTSSNDLLREVLLRGGLDHPADLEVLLAGGTVERTLEENIVLRDLPTRPATVWSLLFYSGYLTAGSVTYHEDGERTVALRLPNLEVRSVYRTIFADYLERGGPAEVKALREALFTGDAHTFQHILGSLIRDVLSYHDFDTRIPERVYHAFLAGLCVTLSADHEVRSNRESGYGRYDVMILPKRPGGPGVVMELKVLKGETVAHALTRAGEQLVERGYVAELKARGATPVSGFAVVFDGKDVFVEAVSLG